MERKIFANEMEKIMKDYKLAKRKGNELEQKNCRRDYTLVRDLEIKYGKDVTNFPKTLR